MKKDDRSQRSAGRLVCAERYTCVRSRARRPIDQWFRSSNDAASIDNQVHGSWYASDTTDSFDAAAQIVWGIEAILRRELLCSPTMYTALLCEIQVESSYV
jgi:hypothetical protein